MGLKSTCHVCSLQGKLTAGVETDTNCNIYTIIACRLSGDCGQTVFIQASA